VKTNVNVTIINYASSVEPKVLFGQEYKDAYSEFFNDTPYSYSNRFLQPTLTLKVLSTRSITGDLEFSESLIQNSF